MDLDMDERELARLLGLGRVVLGVTMFLMPRQAVKRYMGEDDPSWTSAMAIRGMGARDVALGTGLMIALEDDGEIARWLEAGALADAGDFLSTLAHFRQMPSLRRLLWLATAGSATFLGLRLAGALD